jgi:hypothetical protein
VAPRSPRSILRLRATLVGSDPEIWRTVDVDATLTLAELHDVLQICFGWQDSHLHRWTEDDPYPTRRGIPRIGRRPRAWVEASWLEEDPVEGDEDEADTTIAEAMQFDGPVWYEYDMGDGWVHRIDLIERAPARPGEPRASVVAGERRAPFEDSGGLGGYEEKLQILDDRAHPEHEAITDWVRFVAGPWGSTDPDAADLAGAQGELAARFDDAGEDPSRLINPARGIGADSPIVVLANRLSAPLRANLRRHLATTDVLDDLAVGPRQAAEVVRPYQWLLSRVGPDGLALTAAGFLPPTVVRACADELGWYEPWMGQGNREQGMPDVARLRESSESLRLVRKAKGRLHAVARAQRIADDPVALFETVSRMLLRQRMPDADRIASTVLVVGLADGTIGSPEEAAELVLDVLSELGYADPSGAALDGRWFWWLTEKVRAVLMTAGLWGMRGGVDESPSAAVRMLARAALR